MLNFLLLGSGMLKVFYIKINMELEDERNSFLTFYSVLICSGIKQQQKNCKIGQQNKAALFTIRRMSLFPCFQFSSVCKIMANAKNWKVQDKKYEK